MGVPGRVIEQKEDDKYTQAQRAELAKKMGFDAYGVVADAPDPVATAINCMLDHIHMVDEKMEKMCNALKALDSELEDLQMPKLGELEIFTEGHTPKPDAIDSKTKSQDK